MDDEKFKQPVDLTKSKYRVDFKREVFTQMSNIS